MLVKDLEQKMNEKFVGKSWEAHETKWDFLEFIKGELIKAGLEDVAKNLTFGNCEKQEVNIDYKGNFFLYLTISKKKGKYKGYWQGTYEWGISHITINEWGNHQDYTTIEERVAFLENRMIEDKKKKDKELQVLLPIFEEALKLADGNAYVAQTLIEELNKSFYKLLELSQGDK